MTDFVVVCDGRDGPERHDQIRLSNLRDGVFTKRGGGKAVLADNGTVTLKCPMRRCGLAASANSESAALLGDFFTAYPELTITRIGSPKHPAHDHPWPAIRLATLQVALMNMPSVIAAVSA